VTFQCEDLRDFGVVLIPPSSPDYEPLFADIQRRVDHPLEKRETSAILVNQSEKSVAAIDAVWHYIGAIWRYEDLAGRTFDGTRLTTGHRLLLPFSVPAEHMKIMFYRMAILPGSRRYLSEHGIGIAGDNSDVREPEHDEVRRGGCISGFGGGHCTSALPIKSVTLILDGVFFLDGEFAGPNRNGLWEKVIKEATSVMDVAKIARDGRDRGIATAEILREIEELTGPPTKHPAAPGKTMQRRAYQIELNRRLMGDERTVDWLVSMASTPLPDYQRRVTS
jgi:hypothetical protein